MVLRQATKLKRGPSDPFGTLTEGAPVPSGCCVATCHGEQNCPRSVIPGRDHSWRRHKQVCVPNQRCGRSCLSSALFQEAMVLGAADVHWHDALLSSSLIADGTASESLLPEEAVLGWQKVAVESFCLAK